MITIISADVVVVSPGSIRSHGIRPTAGSALALAISDTRSIFPISADPVMRSNGERFTGRSWNSMFSIPGSRLKQTRGKLFLLGITLLAIALR
jgi:hypothetical protein